MTIIGQLNWESMKKHKIPTNSHFLIKNTWKLSLNVQIAKSSNKNLLCLQIIS